MTWAEPSSPAEVELHPFAPPPTELRGAPAVDRLDAPPSDLEAEIGSWTEAPVTVAEGASLSALGERAQALGYLWVELDPPGPEYRGRLGLYIEEGLETKLDQLGAPPAGIHASTSLDASLSDQLYRARFVERRGLALGIPSLEGIANLGRTLDADDSSVLRWWIAATADRPVRLVVSSDNQFLRVYPSPVLFDSLFELAPEPVSPRAPSVALAESAAAMDLSDLPPSVGPAVESADEPEASPEAPLAVASAVTSAEPTTNVLGTRVAPIFDIALPGLDRALGLLDEEPEAEPDHPSTADLASEEPPVVEAAAAELPVLEAVVDAAFDALECESRRAITLAPPPDYEDLVAAAEGPLTPIAAPSAPAALGDPPGIDAAEFLRVLEEDSRPPPAADPVPAPIAAAPEPDVVEPALPQQLASETALEEPTPLPEKKLRRPFLRMAADDAAPVAVSDQSESSAPDVTVRAPIITADESARASAPEPVATPLAGPRSDAERAPAPSGPAPAIDPADPFNQLAVKEWRSWRDALTHAAGPRPLAAIERMFVTDYTRLAEATRRGIADHTARAALAEWQASFQKSYAETFDALRVRGKRPTMVLDLPDIAQRLGRLQGARRVQLLLVDGMRFDLGLMVQERLRAKVDAALTERLLLWSALPTTTTYQLELLGKGPEGLLERWDGEESPTLVARGRAARAARRIRTGRVEVQKIDVVEDALRTLGRPIVERMDEIATDTADAVAEHMAAQSPRTLVVVFGDHGFRLDPARAGTTEEVRQGGSSPEEVLVPAFAWLTGAVH